MSNQTRQPSGTRAGGQYATSPRAETTTGLTAPSAPVNTEATGDVQTHIRAIAGHAGYHPTEGVLPAVLVAIYDRDENDESAILQLTADDLQHLYDAHLGPALDGFQEEIRWIAMRRKAALRR